MMKEATRQSRRYVEFAVNDAEGYLVAIGLLADAGYEEPATKYYHYNLRYIRANNDPSDNYHKHVLAICYNPVTNDSWQGTFLSRQKLLHAPGDCLYIKTDVIWQEIRDDEMQIFCGSIVTDK